jgi:hypothetical protein
MSAQRDELLQQMLETEIGGVQIYQGALSCAINPELKEEWQKYLEQTQRHVDVVRALMKQLRVAEQETSGRKVVRHIGQSLVVAMKMAKGSGGPPEAAELVACECVVFAETKDHLNWELLSKLAEASKGAEAKALRAACDDVEDQEDEHIYHSKGWCRELWIASLGMKAVLPPPEEQEDVKTAVDAALAEKDREQLQ